MTDILEVVARYAPDADPEWSTERQEAVLAAILGRHAAGAVTEIPVHVAFRPARRRRSVTAFVASAAAFTAAASAIVAITLHGSQRGPALAAGTPWDPPPGLSGAAPLAPGRYSRLVFEQIDIGADGVGVPGGQDAMIDRNYVGADGAALSIRSGSQHSCGLLPRQGAPSLEEPTQHFFAALPTDVDKLDHYLRSTVQGSSSLDEAVFVSVGDALRTADGLASPKLKAAMLAVLSRTGGVVLHQGVPDYLGRPAIRADFVDQAIRPGEVHSYYFDPTTFRFLEESFARNGEPATYDGPSPAYTAHAGPGVDPDRLSGPGFVSVSTHESIVDTRPRCPN